MTAHMSVCGPGNDSQGFALGQVVVTLSETGFLTIAGVDPLDHHWSITIPVEHFAAMQAAQPGKANG